MQSHRTHSIVGFLTTLLFASVMLLPCLCGTAMALEVESGGDSDCCPSNEAPAENEDEDPGPDHDCCDGCVVACGEAADIDGNLGEAVLSSTQELTEIDDSSSWWTPDLVATLWLIDQVALFTEGKQPQPANLPTAQRPDRSDTYLQHSTFLI